MNKIKDNLLGMADKLFVGVVLIGLQMAITGQITTAGLIATLVAIVGVAVLVLVASKLK